MADYNASSFQYRPGISQQSAEMQRHGGMISAEQTMQDNAAQQAQQELLLSMLMQKTPLSGMKNTSPWFPSDADAVGATSIGAPMSSWQGIMRQGQ